MNPSLPASWRQATAFFDGLKRPVLFSHARPDGDAIGSLLALHGLLTDRGLGPRAVLFEPIPPMYAFVRGASLLEVLPDTGPNEAFPDCDGVVVLDTCAFAQLEPVADWLRHGGLPVLAIDHHVNRDESLASTKLIDPTASATCLMLYEWAASEGWSTGDLVRKSLFLGIATDTGWFRFSNTDQRTFAAAAALCAEGVAPHAFHQWLFQQDRESRVRLLGAALRSLEVTGGGRIALQVLTPHDYASCGADSSDTEGIVNEPLRIDSVTVSAIIVDRGEGLIRCSFRSKPPIDGDRPDVDVSAIAAGLGGGGHRRAAAARVEGRLGEVRKHVEEVLVAAVAGQES